MYYQIFIMNKKYKLSDFDYNLPKELIAQEPVAPRDHSRLFLLKKTNGEIVHKHFYDIVDFLNKGDVLVMNNSKVFPARLIGKKKTGGKMEVFLHRYLLSGGSASPKEAEPPVCHWQCLIGGRGARAGLEIFFSENLECKVLKNNNDGTWDIEFNMEHGEMMKVVEKIGYVPLPPYIKRVESEKSKVESDLCDFDKKNYQTIYADDSKLGSVAAPTAGLHFTPELLRKLKNKGVQIEYITLHVGLGTFAPVKIDDITKHKMHSELVEVKKDVIKRIIKAKQEGRRIIAVGTTSVRTLEGLVASKFNKPISQITSYKLPVTTFIYPGYEFKIIDAMITNFHLPKSTLLMLVSALAGKENIDKAYKIAIKNKYRFYSYGDAMFIV